MDKTFRCDDCIVITIPLLRERHVDTQQLLPDKFHCVFKDAYKVFLKGQPKALGTAQIVAGLLIIALGVLNMEQNVLVATYTFPSVLFVASGLVTYAAGHSPNMCVTKFSFSLNIISFFWALSALVASCYFALSPKNSKMAVGIHVMTAVHLFLEMIFALVLIYWESKAVCRAHFNILPLINFKYMEA